MDKNKMDLVLSLNVEEEREAFKDGEINFHFKDLGYYQMYQETADNGEVFNVISDKFVHLIKGDWKGNIKLDMKLLPTKTYKIDKDINCSTKDGTNIKIKITDIEISNVSLKVNVEYEKGKEGAIMTLIAENSAKGGDIKLKHKDGKITQAVGSSVTGIKQNETLVKETMKRSFDSPINLEELKSIIIWGEEIELK